MGDADDRGWGTDAWGSCPPVSTLSLPRRPELCAKGELSGSRAKAACSPHLFNTLEIPEAVRRHSRGRAGQAAVRAGHTPVQVPSPAAPAAVGSLGWERERP